MVRDKNFFKVRGKSGNFTSSQGTFYGHESSHWSWNWTRSWWWVFKKVDPFLALLLRSYQFMYTACVWLKAEINKWLQGIRLWEERWVHYKLSELKICAIVNSVGQGSFTVVGKKSGKSRNLWLYQPCQSSSLVHLVVLYGIIISDLVMTWGECKSKMLLILRINCNGSGAFKWKNKIVTSQRKDLLYTMQCI